MSVLLIVVAAIAAVVVVVAIHDIVQRKHAVLRNFPVIGHFRYWLEHIGPELRQYIVANNDEERPFSRDQRRWVYASAKQQNNYYGFGTDDDLEVSPNHVIIKHVSFPAAQPAAGQVGAGPEFDVPCAKVVGAYMGRPHAFRPDSVVNVSAMSYGSLSAPAVEALNRGAALAGCMQNTGEGGLTSYHQMGGDLVFQVGTGYFGVRDDDGNFCLDKLTRLVEENPIRMIEVKLSQGAKPGHGGVLPATKVTPEIAAFRGVRVGRDCISPPGHSEFSDATSMIDFIERIAEATGLPVGIKAAVGEMGFWEDLARRMADSRRGPDFITIDGGEGGTGAAPLVFSDHVSLPYKIGMSRVYSTFARYDMHENVTFIGAGKLGFPEEALVAFALGADMVNVAREAMLAIGCIQAQRCHTNSCPTGVATQSKWLMRGLDPTDKSARLANYVITLRKELLELSRTCGVEHPGFISPDSLEIVNEAFVSRPVHEIFGYQPGWGVPSPEDQAGLRDVLGAPTLAPSEAGNVRD